MDNLKQMEPQVGDLVIDNTNPKLGPKVICAVSYDHEGQWIKLQGESSDSWFLSTFFTIYSR